MQVNTDIASRGGTMAVDWERRIDFARLLAAGLVDASEPSFPV